ncbi:MAG: PqqD family peptide modification chaperone [Inquilinus sp.]|uniref:PqqD family peptide modification chaperone n=1 Tax=Inquilinus sp. TaxID=1932117 RepID=UPI003F3E8512
MFVGSDAVRLDSVIAAGTAFAVVGQRKLLFSETRQEIFELNDMAAYIWCRLEEGDPPSVAAGRLVDLGVPAGDADGYVRDMLSDWHRLGLIIGTEGDVAASMTSEGDDRQQRLDLAGLSIEIRYATDALARLAAPAFAHLQGGGPRPPAGSSSALSLSIKAEGDLFRLWSCGQEIGAYDLDEIVPALKAQLTADVLACADYSVAIHAAALACDGRMMLLCGEPGAGKTTLAVALAHRGLDFAGDDIALLMPSGQVRGVPFSASVKSGAWPLVSSFRPDLEQLRIFRRSDNQHVRYLSPAVSPMTGALRLGWVVLLRRQPHGAAVLTPVDRIEAMRALLAEATAPGRRLSASAFGLLAEAVAGADCFTLTYADLDDAVRELRRACA